MRESLLKKRYGIPAALLLLILAGTAVAATGVAVLNVIPTISYPTHESLTIDLGDIPAGHTVTGAAEGFIGLPRATYDMTWELSGDLDKFSSVSIDVWVDLNDSASYQPAEKIGTLTKDITQISKNTVSGLLETKTKYVVSVTAEDDVACVGTSIVSNSANLTVSWNASHV